MFGIAQVEGIVCRNSIQTVFEGSSKKEKAKEAKENPYRTYRDSTSKQKQLMKKCATSSSLAKHIKGRHKKTSSILECQSILKNVLKN